MMRHTPDLTTARGKEKAHEYLEKATNGGICFPGIEVAKTILGNL